MNNKYYLTQILFNSKIFL